MYYRLKQEYVLRGWDKMAWTLVRRPDNKIKILKQEEFQALLLCDGTMDSDHELISEDLKLLLHRYEKEGIIELYESKKELDEDQFYRYCQNRYIRNVFWSITGKCNFKCRHCFMEASEGKLGEISHEQAIELIDQMEECGVLCVDITGGEPFVRKDFWELVDRILSYKMVIRQIYTNGWLLNENVFQEFERRNLKPEFSISFDGVGWHDWMRGINGAEKAVFRALELCKKYGFPVNVEMCVHKGNQNILRETVEQLTQMNVTRLKTSNILQTELWKRNSEGNALDNAAYTEAMIRYIPDFFRDGMPMDVMLSGVVMLHKHSKNYSILPVRYDGTEKCRDRFLCGVARYTCYITPEGRLLPCMPMTAFKEQNIFPLVQNIGLKKGLSDSIYMKIIDNRVKDLLAENAKCSVCEYKYQCGGGCRAIALEQTGGFMGCDGNQCQLWAEGYVERIRRTAEEAIAEYCPE